MHSTLRRDGCLGFIEACSKAVSEESWQWVKAVVFGRLSGQDSEVYPIHLRSGGALMCRVALGDCSPRAPTDPYVRG
jgi:hypothetical protein